MIEEAKGNLLLGALDVGSPYLGLPFEPKPRFLDCYPQALWDGKAFVETGRTICLGGQ